LKKSSLIKLVLFLPLIALIAGCEETQSNNPPSNHDPKDKQPTDSIKIFTKNS